MLTYRQVVQAFTREVMPTIRKKYEQDGIPDKPARREAWNNFVDYLAKDGQVSEKSYDWPQPPITDGRESRKVSEAKARTKALQRQVKRVLEQKADELDRRERQLLDLVKSSGGSYTIGGFAHGTGSSLYRKGLVKMEQDPKGGYLLTLTDKGRATEQQEQLVLKKDSKVIMTGTSFEIAKYIHNHHSYSVAHALRYEGYKIEPVKTQENTREQADPKFDQWMKKVDAYVWRLVGASVHDLADVPFRDWFESGISPQSAAKKALKYSGWQ